MILAVGVAVAVGAAAMTVALMAASRWVPVTDDEAWFLQVTNRCLRGEALYRDVFYGAGPLPLWIALAVVRGRRAPMVALRVVGVAYFVGLLAAGSWLLAVADAPVSGVLALSVGTLAFASPASAQDSHYAQLALLAAVGAVGLVLHAGESGPLVEYGLAGAAAGVSYSSKPNIGLVATVALGAAAFNAGGAAAAVWLLLGAVAVATACLAPLARNEGALRWYARRVFVNKGAYLAAGIGVLDGVRQAVRRPFANRIEATLVPVAAVATYLVLPAVMVAVVGTVTASGGPALVAPTTLALAAIAAAAALPRADMAHVRSLFPVALLTVLYAAATHPAWLESLPDAARQAGAMALGLLTALGLARSIASVARSRRAGSPADRAVPSFAGLPVRNLVTPACPADGGALRDHTGGRVFLLRRDASFWYVASGLENPTPYDYPFATVFGPHGQREVIEKIRAGDVAWVCWPGPTTGPLRPAELEEFVASSMVAVAETPAGTLYRLAPDAAPSRNTRTS